MREQFLQRKITVDAGAMASGGGSRAGRCYAITKRSPYGWRWREVQGERSASLSSGHRSCTKTTTSTTSERRTGFLGGGGGFFDRTGSGVDGRGWGVLERAAERRGGTRRRSTQGGKAPGRLELGAGVVRDAVLRCEDGAMLRRIAHASNPSAKAACVDRDIHILCSVVGLRAGAKNVVFCECVVPSRFASRHRTRQCAGWRGRR